MKNLTYYLLIPVLMAGCTHTARITKSPMAAAPSRTMERPVSVGFEPVGNQPLLEAAINQFQMNPSVGACTKNYKAGTDSRAEYVCQLSMEPKFKASGQNFFIAFPGYLVFTHALVGYKYKADLKTHSILEDAQGNPVSEIDIAAPYEFRHCSFARGASAGICGWLVPGYGAAAIVPGAIFAGSYDKRATKEFEEKVQANYAALISAKVLEQVDLADQARSATPKPAPETPQSSPQPLPVNPATSSTSEPATETEYAVYVMRVDGNQVGEPEVSVRDVSAFSRGTMDRMSASMVAADTESLGLLLTELGVTPGEFFGGLDRAKVYRQVDDQLMPLIEPRRSAEVN